MCVRLILAALIGLPVGSFISVVAHRLPIMLEHAWAQEEGKDFAGTYVRYNLWRTAFRVPIVRSRSAAMGKHPALGIRGIAWAVRRLSRADRKTVCRD